MNRTEIESALVGALQSGFPGVISAYLFGSVADQRSHRESDVDVGVLLARGIHESARQRFDQRLLLSSALQSAVRGKTADVVILNDAPPHLARQIVTRGRRLYCTDTEIDHAFVRDVQLRAADLEPFLRRMRRIKLEAMEGRDVPRRATG